MATISSSTATGTLNTAAVKNSVSDILGFKSDALTNKANATAETTSSEGYAAEIKSYGEAADVSRQNAVLADASGRVKQLQDQRDYLKSSGAERAAIAGNGFQTSGTALYQLTDSLQQSYLQDQIDRTQSLFDQVGYLEQARASDAQSDAAAIAKKGATTASTSYSSIAALDDLYATNETALLSKYLKQYGTSADTKLATGVLAGTETGDTLGATTGSKATGSLFGDSDPPLNTKASSAKTVQKLLDSASTV